MNQQQTPLPDFGHLFRQIYQLLRTTPSLWWLAFAGVLATELITTSATLLAASTAFTSLSPEAFFNLVASWGETPGRLALFALAVTAIFAVIWLITAVTSGGIIVGTQTKLQGNSFSWQDGIRHGRRLLWPFVVIDTILFLPIFLILLLMLAIIAGGLVLAITGDTSDNSAVTTLVISLLCTIPFILLTVPVGFLTAVYRNITLRDTALNNTAPRATLKRVYPLLKQQWQTTLILIVLGMALSAFPTAFVRLFTALTAFIPITLGILISACLRLAANTALHLVISTMWTIIVHAWWTEESAVNPDLPTDHDTANN